MDFSDEVPGFVVESTENLALLDLELVQLEKNPDDDALIASVFRTIHTVKGTSGFFGFSILGSITHVAENILGQVREKERRLTPELVSLVLETVDAVRKVLTNIESSGAEGPDTYQPLRDRLESAFASVGDAADLSRTADQAQTVLAHTERRNTDESVTPQPYNRRADDVASSPSTIRVDVRMLDKLMNLVGELVLARNQIVQGAQQSVAQSASAQRLNLITSELQEGVMRTRMQPIGVVWNKLPRVVRDLASDLGKTIDLEMVGAETELDKTIIEAIKDPLTHIVRNSCDHGIERPEHRLAKGKNAAGRIILRAFHESGHVNIEMSDDGSGMDPERVKNKAIQKGLIRAEQAALLSDREALRLIFLPGFSTAETVTGISGRGVGMDVVKTNIEKISGAIDMDNRPGYGMTIKIKIPLTLAIIPGLVVTVKSDANPGCAQHGQRFVIPQGNLLELVRLEGPKGRAQMECIGDADILRRRGTLLPIVYLSELLGLATRRLVDEAINIVVLKAEDTAFGLVVDEINDTQEIVVKALGKQLKSLNWYVGATIMGDGKIALIFDVVGLAKLAKVLMPPQERPKLEAGSSATLREVQQLLLFRAGRFAGLVLDLSFVARLEEIAWSRLEYAAGEPVVRYREALLPLVWLSDLLEGASASGSRPVSLQVIVFSEDDRHIGLVVDEIVDILDDVVTHRQASTRFGLLASGVAGDRLVDFVDLDAIRKVARKRPSNQRHSEEMSSIGETQFPSDFQLEEAVLQAEDELVGSAR